MAAFAADIEWYYLDAESENLGPFTLAEMAGFYGASSITDGTFVWHEDIKDEAWASVEDVEGLKEELASQAPAAEAEAAPAAEEKKEAAPAEEAAPAAGARMSGRRGSVEAQAKDDATTAAKAKTIARVGSVAKMPPAGPKDNDTLLKLLSQKSYQAQAEWFLNAYWEGAEEERGNLCFKDKPEECEKVWTYMHSCGKYDKKLGEAGNELDEFEAHLFLEKEMGALTVKKLREVSDAVDGGSGGERCAVWRRKECVSRCAASPYV
jgi:hypothetical protein